ncbi:MAG TPA: hypothetical protein VGR02_04895 [Thermoanaerobaculia bacterium]|nr:hypothetical protein [Thermoanaerobaculia bacterium]
MPTLAIDLQDGFENDEVVIRVDGEERARRTGVTTKRLYGLAETVEVPAGGPVTLELQVPTRGASKTLPVDATRDLWIGVSLQGGEIHAAVSVEPYGYA